MIRFFSLLLIAILVGCATSLRRDTRVDEALTPPSPERVASWRDLNWQELQAVRTTSPRERWWLSVRAAENALAADRKDVACGEYRKLSGEKSFILAEWALLRAHELCPSTEDLASIDTVSPATRKWFAETLVRAEQTRFDSFTPEEKTRFLWKKGVTEKDDRQRELAYIDALGWAERSGDAALKSEATAKLYQNSPRLNPAPTDKDWAAIAGDFRRWREFGRAVQIERRRFESRRTSPEEKFLVLKNIRQTYKVSQNKPETLKASQEWAKYAFQQFKRRGKKDPAWAGRLLEARALWARTLWTENQGDRARKLLLDTQKLLRGKVGFEEVEFILGKMSEEHGEWAEAARHYDLALQEPKANLRDRVLWGAAWAHMKLRQNGPAKDRLKAFSETARDPSDQTKSLFWIAKITQRDDANAARPLFAELVDKDPLGYYGVLATRELGQMYSPLASTASDKDVFLWRAPEWPQIAALSLEWLISTGVQDGTNALLEEMQSQLTKNAQATSDAWLRLSLAYARAGQSLPLFAAIGQMDPGLRKELVLKHPELLFPRPYADLVDSASKKTGVPSEMLYAIMRQESAFNPRARSPADAYGLTQLLPSVAAQIARDENIRYTGFQDLYEPETSIPLGAFELKRLLKRHRQQWIPAVAGYNASEAAVRGWVKARYKGDVLEFIEEIPYEETRAYVKLVMRNQVFYRRLATDAPFEFPENCLKIDSSVSN